MLKVITLLLLVSILTQKVIVQPLQGSAHIPKGIELMLLEKMPMLKAMEVFMVRLVFQGGLIQLLIL
jgi:hypothetical protein